MKISKLTNGLLVSLLLSASAVEAGNDYPATDFQPKVVYQDADYKHTGSPAPSKAKASSGGEVSVADPAYPAANFQPEVLFEDKAYKHTKGNEGKSIRTEFVKKYAEEQIEEYAPVSSESSDDSSMSLIMGLAVLAIAGFVFYSKNAIKLPARKKKPVSKKSPARRAATAKPAGDGSTSGVSKYLESKVGTKPSGVAKYLEDRDSSPVSGVAKYVAKKKVSARLASVTGVEKYLKDRG